MSGVRYILVAEGAHTATGDPIGLNPGDTNPYLDSYLPVVGARQFAKMFRQITYGISVVGLAGTAATSWSLGAKFEQAIIHTVGWQDSFPQWAPIGAEQQEACILEGVGWYGPGQTPPADPTTSGIIANQASTADDGSGTLPNGGLVIPKVGDDVSTILPPSKRVTVTRTVVNQMGGVRIRLDPLISGGDSTSRILFSAWAVGVR